MGTPTLLRKAEHAALSSISLSGTVVDLGGVKHADYLAHLKGTFAVTTVNLDANAKPDVVHNLEQPFPFKDAAFNHALLINVMEHIFDFRQLLRETARVVAKDGTAVIVVPFMFPLHPSPNDYWRFSDAALTKECMNAGFSNVDVMPLGSGVLAARFLFIDRLLPAPLRMLFSVLHPVVTLMDALLVKGAKITHKAYQRSDYALGYRVIAKK